MSFLPRSFRMRLLLACVMALGLVMIFSTVQSMGVVRQALVENARTNVQQISAILNLSIAPGTATGQFEPLRDFLTEMLAPRAASRQGNGLVYVVVAGEDGAIILRAGDAPRKLPGPDALSLEAVERGLLHVRQPILLKNNRVGYLQFGLATGALVEASYGAARQSLLIAGVGLLLLTGALLLMGLTVAHQVEGLARASKALAEGDLGVRAAEYQSDEFSLLARNFNRMAEAIQARVNELQRSREEVMELNQTLEQRVSERTRELHEKNAVLEKIVADLNSARNQLLQAEKMAGLGALVAGVAHELNTPIGNAVIASSTLAERTRAFLKEYEGGLRRSSLERYMETAQAGSDLIQRNLSRASELIAGFKQVAADQTSSQRREFELKSTLAEIVATLAPSFRKTAYRLELDVQEGLLMDSYPGPLGQVISNLVINALTHAFAGREQGLMRLSAHQDETPGRVLIVFSDDGIGIPQENLSRVFDPFFTTRRGQGGSGLGLHIVYNIISGVMGGEIRAESTAMGTRFLISLPLVAPKREAA